MQIMWNTKLIYVLRIYNESTNGNCSVYDYVYVNTHLILQRVLLPSASLRAAPDGAIRSGRW